MTGVRGLFFAAAMVGCCCATVGVAHAQAPDIPTSRTAGASESSAGVPVFELVGIEKFGDSWGPAPMPQGAIERFYGPSNSRYYHFRRLTDAVPGEPGKAKYTIPGRALPDEFWVAADRSGRRLPTVLVNPHPWPYGTLWDVAMPTASLLVGPSVMLPGVGEGPAGVAVAVPLITRPQLPDLPDLGFS